MYYTDNQQKIDAAYSIPAHMLDDIRDEHRKKIHIGYSLSRALRDEAEKVVQKMGWVHYLFIEIAPHEWPDAPPKRVRLMRFEYDPILEVRASAHIFERLPDWNVREMENTPHLLHALGFPRPVATLNGERGHAIAGDGTIFFWPERSHF